MPLTIPILAQVSRAAIINGNVNKAVQSVAKPSEAPATAYVPMPEGSSSEAPVTSPGPSRLKKRLTRLLSSIMAASSETVPPAGSEWGVTACFTGLASVRLPLVTTLSASPIGPIVMILSREIYKKEKRVTKLCSRLCVRLFRLIARPENISFAPASMDQLGDMLVVDLPAQVVDVNLDRIRERIE